jgi:hypothetical protein
MKIPRERIIPVEVRLSPDPEDTDNEADQN